MRRLERSRLVLLPCGRSSSLGMLLMVYFNLTARVRLLELLLVWAASKSVPSATVIFWNGLGCTWSTLVDDSTEDQAALLLFLGTRVATLAVLRPVRSLSICLCIYILLGGTSIALSSVFNTKWPWSS